jgi:UDP-N-acetylglucosamine enolpyruvyl transferase
LLRSLPAVSQSLASKPRLAEESVFFFVADLGVVATDLLVKCAVIADGRCYLEAACVKCEVVFVRCCLIGKL